MLNQLSNLLGFGKDRDYIKWNTVGWFRVRRLKRSVKVQVLPLLYFTPLPGSALKFGLKHKLPHAESSATDAICMDTCTGPLEKLHFNAFFSASLV